MSADRIDRRSFLSLVAKTLFAVISALIAIPAIGYVFAPLRRRRGGGQTQADFENLGPVENITPDNWILIPLDVVQQDGWEQVREHHSVYVRRHGDKAESVSVLSPICTHLGCPVNWDPKNQQFRCPCHGGVYNADGTYLSGPPPRSLDPLPFQVEDGRLLVQWVDYKVGVAERVAVEV